MATPEEKYYDAMNTVLAPVRWAKSLMQTALIVLLLLGVGLFYPIIQILREGHVTATGLVVSFLAALFIFTFCYAPWYTVVGGILCFVVFYVCCGFQSFLDNLTGRDILLFIFAFLVVGILQRFIRHRMFDLRKEPKPKPLSFAEQLNQDSGEVWRGRFHAMDVDVRCFMIGRYGDDYLKWPRPWPEQLSSNADRQNQLRPSDSSGDLSADYEALGLQNGATPEEVKQAYRDLVMVWHPDRFAGGEARLKRKAEEQLKAINDAYERIQKHQRSQWKGRGDDSVASPVNDINDRGESQVTRQSTAETAARETAERQSPSASAADDSGTTMQESEHKVQTEDELIEAIDATRRRVDESTKKMEEFLEQMRGQLQRR